MGQLVTLDEEMVVAGVGARTVTASPHLESAVVIFVPPEAIDAFVSGRVSPVAEMVSVFESLGTEADALLVHLRT